MVWFVNTPKTPTKLRHLTKLVKYWLIFQLIYNQCRLTFLREKAKIRVSYNFNIMHSFNRRVYNVSGKVFVNMTDIIVIL